MDLEYLLEKEAGMDMPEEKIEEVELLELEEYLDNMGYIAINQNDEDRVVDWKQIHEGILTYRAEYKAYHPFFTEHSNTFKYTYDPAIASAAIAGELTEEELDFLAHVSSIEGEFNLHELPQKVIKANPFLNRVINYRLSILGLVRPILDFELAKKERDFLKKDPSAEGEFNLHDFSLTEIKDYPFLKRNFNYRLSTLGLVLRINHTEYSDDTNTALEKLGVWAGVPDYAEQIKLTGDIHQLSIRLAKRQQYPESEYKQIAYVKDGKGRSKERGNKDRFKKMENFHFLTQDSKEAFERRERASDAQMDLVVHDPLNQLMLRIVQVKLWCLGTYPGKLDSDIGPISVQAIKDVMDYLREMVYEEWYGPELTEEWESIRKLVEEKKKKLEKNLEGKTLGVEKLAKEREKIRKKVETKKNNLERKLEQEQEQIRKRRHKEGRGLNITIEDILLKLEGEYWVINTTYFLGTIFPVLLIKKPTDVESGGANRESEEDKAEQKTPTTISGQVGDLVAGIPTENQDEFYKELKDLVNKKEESTVSRGPKNKKKRKVKTRGGRDLFRTVGRFFGSIIKSIARGIKFIINSIKKLFKWIKNGIKVLIREIKKVFKLLRKGVQFIFGKKKIITKDETTQTVITTHYDADFDSVTRMNQTQPKLIEIHLEKNRDILLALEECSNFLGMALFIVVHITPPVGWLKLGIKLIRYLAGTRFQYQRFSFPGQ